MPKIYPEIVEAKIILETASEYTGWGMEDMLDVICDYLNEFHNTEHFLKYVQEVVDEECEE